MWRRIAHCLLAVSVLFASCVAQDCGVKPTNTNGTIAWPSNYNGVSLYAPDCVCCGTFGGINNTVYVSFSKVNVARGDRLFLALYSPYGSTCPVDFRSEQRKPPAKTFKLPLNNMFGPALLLQFQEDATFQSTGVLGKYWSIPVRQCNETSFSLANGEFATQNQIDGFARYAPSMRCQFTFTAQSGQHVGMYFRSFSTEPGVDTLTLYDGPNAGSPQIATLSGFNVPAPVSSTGQTMTVVFTTDGQNEYFGIQANWVSYTQSAQCATGPTVVSGSTGVISAPFSYDGYSRYATDTMCAWNITATGANNNRVRLDFIAMSTEAADVVVVYDGIDETAPCLGSFSGSVLPDTIFSTSRNVYVTFASDSIQSSLNVHGFALQWTAIPFMRCVASTDLGTSNAATLTFTPGANDLSNLGTTCLWTFNAASQPRVAIAVPVLALGAGESIALYDGADDAAPLIASFVGTTVAATTARATQQTVTVAFTSQSATPTAFTIGLSATNQSSGCLPQTFLSGATGMLMDPYQTTFGGSLSSHGTCFWTITVPSGYVLFNASEIALGTDSRLRVYNGPTVDDQLLLDYAPLEDVNITVVAASGATLLVELRTGIVPSFGFMATWSSLSSYGACGTVSLPSATGSAQLFSYPPNADGILLYQPNSHCVWSIQAPAGQVVVLTSVMFYTQVLFDSLSVYSGTSSSGELMLEQSGYSEGTPYIYLSDYPMPPIASRARDMYIEFNSDEDTEYPGFILSYTAVAAPTTCSGLQTLSGAGGVIAPVTPFNLAFRYTLNTQCGFLITANAGQRVLFNVTYISFDYASVHYSAYAPIYGYYGTHNFSIYDGSNSSAPLLGTFYALSFPRVVASTFESLFVQFRTTGEGRPNSPGFSATWTSVNGPAACQRFVTLTTNGTFYFPDDPSGIYRYLPNQNCTWYIVAPAGQRVKWRLVGGSMAAGDYLTITPGLWNNQLPTDYMFRTNGVGSVDSSTDYVSPGNSITVNVVTDGAVQGYGFQIIFSFTTAYGSCINAAYPTGTSGYIEAPIPYDGVNVYRRGQCRWQWDASPTYNQIRFSVVAFQLGTSTTLFAATNVNTYGVGASSTPFAMATVASGPIYVSFTSITDVTGAGFKLAWEMSTVTGCGGLGQVLTGAGGTITSHSPYDLIYQFLPNSDCSWTIQASAPNTQIRLYLDSFAIPPSAALAIYNGNSTLSPLLYGSSAAYLGGVVGGTTVYVRFISSTVVTTGFSLRWEAGTAPAMCSGLSQVTGSGYIENPVPWDGANKYLAGVQCQYLLYPSTGYTQVVVYYESIALGVNDHLKIYDGGTPNSPVIADLTTATPTLPLASTGANLLLTFSSTATGYGYKLNWTSTVAPPVCAAYNFPADQAQGTLDYPPPWGAGFRYTGGLDCLFVLHAPGSQMSIVMKQLSTKTGDIVTIYDGYHTGASVMNSYTVSPSAYNSRFGVPSVTGEWALVRLQTQLLSVPDYGFSMTYAPTAAGSQCPQSANVPESDCDYEGVIMSPNPAGPQQYMSDLGGKQCTWLIRANTGRARLNITLWNLYTTTAGDFRLYDGNSSAAPTPLYTAGYGFGPVSSVLTTGPFAFITWHPNGPNNSIVVNWTAITDTGSPLNYGCVPPAIPVAPIMTTTADPAAPAVVVGLSGTVIGIIAAVAIVAAIGVAIAVFVVIRRRKQRDRDENGDSTVRMDIGPTAVMKKRINTLLKQSSTKQIGKGGTAVVFRVNMEDGQWVAMKQLMDTSEASKVEFHKEVTIFSRLTGKEHPNVLRLILFCHDPAVIVCELAEKGSLHRMRKELGTMDVAQRKTILVQVAEGMRFLHENDIVHLDLKPENVLVGEGNVLKISDFGTSLILGQDVPVDTMGLSVVTTFTGTPQYSAPERFNHGRAIDLKRADVFSYGVMAWSVVTGEMPFDGETGETVMNIHLTSAFNSDKHMPLPSSADPIMADIVRRAIMPDFRARPLFFDIATTLRNDDLSAVPTMNYSVAPSSLGKNSPMNSVANPAFTNSTTASMGSDYPRKQSRGPPAPRGTDSFDSTAALATIAPPPPPSSDPNARRPSAFASQGPASVYESAGPSTLASSDSDSDVSSKSGVARKDSRYASLPPDEPAPAVPSARRPSGKANPFAKPKA